MSYFCLFLLLFTLNTELETKEHFKGLSYNVSEGAALFLPFHSVWPSVCTVQAMQCFMIMFVHSDHFPFSELESTTQVRANISQIVLLYSSLIQGMVKETG